jgi:hypothetical protein
MAAQPVGQLVKQARCGACKWRLSWRCKAGLAGPAEVQGHLLVHGNEGT